MSVGRQCRSWGSETISHPGHGYHHQGPSSHPMDGKQGKGPALHGGCCLAGCQPGPAFDSWEGDWKISRIIVTVLDKRSAPPRKNQGITHEGLRIHGWASLPWMFWRSWPLSLTNVNQLKVRRLWSVKTCDISCGASKKSGGIRTGEGRVVCVVCAVELSKPTGSLLIRENAPSGGRPCLDRGVQQQRLGRVGERSLGWTESPYQHPCPIHVASSPRFHVCNVICLRRGPVGYGCTRIC